MQKLTLSHTQLSETSLSKFLFALRIMGNLQMWKFSVDVNKAENYLWKNCENLWSKANWNIYIWILCLCVHCVRDNNSFVLSLLVIQSLRVHLCSLLKLTGPKLLSFLSHTRTTLPYLWCTLEYKHILLLNIANRNSFFQKINIQIKILI